MTILVYGKIVLARLYFNANELLYFKTIFDEISSLRVITLRLSNYPSAIIIPPASGTGRGPAEAGNFIRRAKVIPDGNGRTATT